jgi:hypothetical protein
MKKLLFHGTFRSFSGIIVNCVALDATRDRDCVGAFNKELQTNGRKSDVFHTQVKMPVFIG